MNTYKPINPNFPPVVKNLIIINVLAWIASITLPRFGVDLVDLLGLHYWESEQFNLIQLVTYMFLHDTSSISHLFFNMFGIWMFGKNIELYWGPKKFLTFYFVSGIGAAIIQELVWMYSLHPVLDAFNQYANTKDASLLMPYLNGLTENMHIPMSKLWALKEQFLNMHVTVGASGALFGILLGFAVLFPQARMVMIFFPVPIRAPYFVAIYAAAELFMGVIPSSDGIAHFAHLGGMIFAGILLLLWKKKGNLYE
ncbi:MAG: rhomboid family intramembrane serine protease [Paludibacteraceae bacterium]|jgi:membrane associated rhomboid family serine protease|nr:rhomboid family intramembrane serine protease [Paludibacteraceae bacterium]